MPTAETSAVFGAWAARRPPSQGSRRAARQDDAHERAARSFEQTVSACCCLAQAWAWSQGHAAGLLLSVGSHFWQAALLAMQLACLALLLFAKRDTWRKYRVWAIGAVRLCLFHEPLMHKMELGLDQLLNSSASPGALGAASDWARALAGLRLLPIIFSGLAFYLPPTAALVQQAGLVYLASSWAGACTAPLLTDHLSTRRIAGLYDLLDSSDLLLPVTGGPGSQSGSSGGALSRCEAVVGFHALVLGLLLPVALACRTATLPQESRPPKPRRHAGLQRRWPPDVALLLSRLADAVHSSDAALRRIFRSLDCSLPSLALGWLVLGNCWVVTKALAGRW